MDTVFSSQTKFTYNHSLKNKITPTNKKTPGDRGMHQW